MQRKHEQTKNCRDFVWVMEISRVSPGTVLERRAEGKQDASMMDRHEGHNPAFPLGVSGLCHGCCKPLSKPWVLPPLQHIPRCVGLASAPGSPSGHDNERITTTQPPHVRHLPCPYATIAAGCDACLLNMRACAIVIQCDQPPKSNEVRSSPEGCYAAKIVWPPVRAMT